jgi:hypothetical protein
VTTRACLVATLLEGPFLEGKNEEAIMKHLFTACACILLAAIAASAQLAPNQTNGFGNGKLVTFTYEQNFDCVDQPAMDLDFNHIRAQSDPNEMQMPICQPVTEPTADPSGANIKNTAHLYVLIPMFSVDNDHNPSDAMPCPNGGRPGELCGPALGTVLIQLFGFVPEAWKTKVNSAITILVLQQSDWPAADGSSGITSSKLMDEAEAAGRAVEVGSNFFLFFNSRMNH